MLKSAATWRSQGSGAVGDEESGRDRLISDDGKVTRPLRASRFDLVGWSRVTRPAPLFGGDRGGCSYGVTVWKELM